MHDILLETGTNEVEFLEFYLKNQSFGVNVAKVKQLIRFDEADITKLPQSYRSVVGTICHLERNIPVVNLGTHLNRPMRENNDHRIVIITDFNKATTGFIVDGVNKIHRITWDKLQPVSMALEHLNPRITGVVLVEEREVLILDFEYILDDIKPDVSINQGELLATTDASTPTVMNQKERRQKAQVYYAEDSSLFRGTMVQSLAGVGYTSVKAFENGKDLHNEILRMKVNLKDGEMLKEKVHLVLTDIEMPQMDGLTLCKNLKDIDQNIPVVVLSSLITDEMQHKCESVGANANISKKSLDGLLKILDGYLV